MKLRDLLAGVPLGGARLDLEMEINSISADPCAAAPGVLFVDLSADMSAAQGALYAGSAVISAKNCPGCLYTEDPWQTLSALADNWYCRPGGRMVLIAVAGRGDAELAAHLLRELLERMPHVRAGEIGPNSARINGVELPDGQRVPGGLCVRRLLRRMADERCTHVILRLDEISLARREADGLHLSVTAMTGPVEDRCALTRLLSDSDMVVYNLDERDWEPYGSLLPARTFTYSENKNSADLVAKNLRVFPGHVEFEALTVGQIQRVHLPAPGGLTVYHGLFALSCGLCLGLKLERMARVLRSAKGLRRRLEVLSVQAAYTVVLDCAGTPGTLERLLTCAREFTAGQLVCVLSCPARNDPARSALMGSVAEQLADQLILTLEEGQTEGLAPIRTVLSGTGSWQRPCVVEPDRRKAICSALDQAQPGDVIVLTVPGEETEERSLIRQYIRQHHPRRVRGVRVGL